MAEPKQVKLHPGARTDLEESVQFYGARSEYARMMFKEGIAEGFRTIADAPERHPKVPELKDVRKFRMPHFPFSILYVDRPLYVWVVAIAHGSRRPGYWKERLRE